MKNDHNNFVKSKLVNKVVATREITNKALMLIKEKYGIGNYFGNNKNHPGHDLDHTLMVSLATDMIYKKALANKKILDYHIIYLRIASTLHDIEQDAKDIKGKISPDVERIVNKYRVPAEEVCNEKISALIAREMMIETCSFDESEINLVEQMIMGTKIHIDETGRIHQAAKNGSYLDKILADADLAHLGGSLDYFKKSFDRYLQERYNGSPKPKRWEIYHEEKNFLEQHEYLTPEAKNIFNLKQININYCESQMKYSR